MPQVGIVMGSDSDLPCMSEAAKMLACLGISYEITIVSAHRTPKQMEAYVETAEAQGVAVIIAGAGGAAHLPGMLAAFTPLPVIGVPVASRAMNGLDSLYSIVQMPTGVPVATVAIGNAANAGILAASILGASDLEIRKKVREYKAELSESVQEKAQTLQKIGYEAYLVSHPLRD